MDISKPVELAGHIAGFVAAAGTEEEKAVALLAQCNAECLSRFHGIVELALEGDYDDNPIDPDDVDGGSAEGDSGNA